MGECRKRPMGYKNLSLSQNVSHALAVCCLKTPKSPEFPLWFIYKLLFKILIYCKSKTENNSCPDKLQQILLLGYALLGCVPLPTQYPVPGTSLLLLLEHKLGPMAQDFTKIMCRGGRTISQSRKMQD